MNKLFLKKGSRKTRYLWVLLAIALITIFVAVCFLTEPLGHTLANILELQPREITQIRVSSTLTTADIEKETGIQELLNFLDTLKYDPVPAADQPVEGLTDENNWNYPSIEIRYEDRAEQILFTYDFDLFWTRDADGNCSLPYRLKEPARMQEYMNNHIAPVNNLEASAKPFAWQDQPFQWLHGVGLDALRSAKCKEGFLSVAQAEALTGILNSIPEDAIGQGRYFEKATFDPRNSSLPYILMRDDANDLTAILTYYNDATELSLVSSSDYEAYYREKIQASVWIYPVESSGLRSFFKELEENPPNMLATAASGYRFHKQLEVLSDGDFTMSFHMLENWDYEIIRPQDGKDYFGFRCRPKKEEEGWITFGWWKDGYPSEYPETEQSSNLHGYHYTYSDGAPAAGDQDFYYTRVHCSHGDFVTTYENTHHWKAWYRDTASWLNFWVNITCELPHTRTQIPQEIALDLASVAYFDWDAIAEDLETQEMTLFHHQYYEDQLFVGCQFGQDFRIARFQNTAPWEYEFVELLMPVPEPLPNDSVQTVPTAEVQLEHSRLKLYIFQEDGLTGVRCHSGFWGYYPISRNPSLFVADAALWGEEEIRFDLHYGNPPQLDFSVQPNGSIFEFLESPQYYLYEGLVSCNDGTNPPDSVSLNTEQLQELAKILLSLPALTQNYEPEVSSDFGDISTGTMPKVHMLLRLDNTGDYLWSERGIQRFPMGDVRLELFYSQDNLILAVHMDDLGNNLYRDVYYFTVDSPVLAAFLLDTCHIFSEK